MKTFDMQVTEEGDTIHFKTKNNGFSSREVFSLNEPRTKTQ